MEVRRHHQNLTSRLNVAIKLFTRPKSSVTVFHAQSNWVGVMNVHRTLAPGILIPGSSSERPRDNEVRWTNGGWLCRCSWRS